MKKNVIRKITIFFIMALFISSTIPFKTIAEKKQLEDPKQDPVLNLLFYQMDFKFDSTLYEYTDWGAVKLYFVGQEPIMYFNLVVNGAWQVQNIPVLSSEGTDVDQVMTYYFDLGCDVGDIITSVTFGYDFTDDILTVMPPELYTAPVANDIVILSAGADGQMPPLAGAKPLVGARAAEANKHAHSNFPNQECGSKECVPAAVSNSLKFLNTKHKLGLTDAQTSIATAKTAVGFIAGRGSPLDTWWETKKKYMKDNNYPIITRKITDISKLAAEIDAGQDVEITESWVVGGKRTGHTTALKGITKLADGNYSLEIIDDRKQGEAGGIDSPRTYIYNPATGNFTEAGFGDTKFEYATVECPDLPKWTYHFLYSPCPGGVLQVSATHNCAVQGPPIYDRYVKYCQTVTGYIPKKINNLEINDVLFDFYWDYFCENHDQIKLVSPKWSDEQNKWTLTSLYPWVQANLDSEFKIVSVGDPTGTIQNVYTLVNLDEYLANPVPPQDEYIIENGLCPMLPGYHFGMTPFMFEPDVGPDDFPFFAPPLMFGVLSYDAEITLSPVPNESPFAPEISGPLKGKPKVEYEYEFVSFDPEGDDVFITINWGDGTSPQTIGPFASGGTAVASHTWSTKGTYELKAKSSDIYGDESEWSDGLSVSIPKTRSAFDSLFFNLIEKLIYRIVELYHIFNIIKV
jgi:hypothetical protein